MTDALKRHRYVVQYRAKTREYLVIDTEPRPMRDGRWGTLIMGSVRQGVLPDPEGRAQTWARRLNTRSSAGEWER
jgi:hypothetical protein